MVNGTISYGRESGGDNDAFVFAGESAWQWIFCHKKQRQMYVNRSLYLKPERLYRNEVISTRRSDTRHSDAKARLCFPSYLLSAFFNVHKIDQDQSDGQTKYLWSCYRLMRYQYPQCVRKRSGAMDHLRCRSTDYVPWTWSFLLVPPY